MRERSADVIVIGVDGTTWILRGKTPQVRSVVLENMGIPNGRFAELAIDQFVDRMG